MLSAKCNKIKPTDHFFLSLYPNVSTSTECLIFNYCALLSKNCLLQTFLNKKILKYIQSLFFFLNIFLSYTKFNEHKLYIHKID